MIAPCYGAVEAAQVLSYRLEAQGDAEFVSFVCDAREAVNEVAAWQGRAFEIECGAKRDLLLVSEKTIVEVQNLTTDARWCWLRFVEDELTEILMLGGSEILFDGAPIFRAARRVELFIAKRDAAKHDDWRVETNAEEYEFDPTHARGVCAAV